MYSAGSVDSVQRSTSSNRESWKAWNLRPEELPLELPLPLGLPGPEPEPAPAPGPMPPPPPPPPRCVSRTQSFCANNSASPTSKLERASEAQASGRRTDGMEVRGMSGPAAAAAAVAVAEVVDDRLLLVSAASDEAAAEAAALASPVAPAAAASAGEALRIACVEAACPRTFLFSLSCCSCCCLRFAMNAGLLAWSLRSALCILACTSTYSFLTRPSLESFSAKAFQNRSMSARTLGWLRNDARASRAPSEYREGSP